MPMNARMLLGATLATIISACVVPQDASTSDSENQDQSLTVGPEGRAFRESADAAAASIDCSAHRVVNVVSYNGTHGQANCFFGYTLVPNYRNQLHKFLIGTDDAVYHTWINLSTGEGSGWERDGGGAQSPVLVGTIADEGLQLCVIGEDRTTFWSKKFFPISGWGPWTNVGTNPDKCAVEFAESFF